jgi:soluble lytic murein transglycosylase-like protein
MKAARLFLLACLFVPQAPHAFADDTQLINPSQYKLRGNLADMKLRNPGEYRLRELRRMVDAGADEHRKALAANPLLAGRPYRSSIAAAAAKQNLDPALVHAVVAAESNYRADAVSSAGAIGLMQLLPETASRYGVRAEDLARPDSNLRAGTRYLADLLRMFSGDLELALAGYNAGEYAVVRYGGRIPPFRATRAYVPRVLQLYEQLRPRDETMAAGGLVETASQL